VFYRFSNGEKHAHRGHKLVDSETVLDPRADAVTSLSQSFTNEAEDFAFSQKFLDLLTSFNSSRSNGWKKRNK